MSELPEWAQWKSWGVPPPSWTAVHPRTGKIVRVYRSVADYDRYEDDLKP